MGAEVADRAYQRPTDQRPAAVERPLELPAMAVSWGSRVPGNGGRACGARHDVKTVLRRAFYRGWALLPEWCQRLAVRLGARKVTLGACALIQDTRGRLLVAHHTYRRRAWGLPGGFAARGEEPASALARELREELGVAGAAVGRLVYAETEAGGRHLTLYYHAMLLGTPRTDGVELDGLRYASLDDVPALFGADALPWLDALRTRRAS
ncbi:MAG: NUDIX hydrolase [Ktedonobacterales bacterium]